LFFSPTLQAEEDVAIRRVYALYLYADPHSAVKDAEKLLEKYPDSSL